MKLTRIDGRTGPGNVEVKQERPIGAEQVAERGVFNVPSGYRDHPQTNGAQIEEQPGRPYSLESPKAFELGSAAEVLPTATGPYAEQINLLLEYVRERGVPERDPDVSRHSANSAEGAALRIIDLLSDQKIKFGDTSGNQVRRDALDTLAQSPEVANAIKQLPMADITETVMRGNRAVSHTMAAPIQAACRLVEPLDVSKLDALAQSAPSRFEKGIQDANAWANSVLTQWETQKASKDAAQRAFDHAFNGAVAVSKDLNLPVEDRLIAVQMKTPSLDGLLKTHWTSPQMIQAISSLKEAQAALVAANNAPTLDNVVVSNAKDVAGLTMGDKSDPNYPSMSDLMSSLHKEVEKLRDARFKNPDDVKALAPGFQKMNETLASLQKRLDAIRIRDSERNSLQATSAYLAELKAGIGDLQERATQRANDMTDFLRYF